MGRLMNEEQKRKYDFVRTTLAKLLRETLHNQHYCTEYYIDEYGAEWVDVSFDNEDSICKVRVTGDNLRALVIDVLRRI